jgi:hypothetical protein
MGKSQFQKRKEKDKTEAVVEHAIIEAIPEPTKASELTERGFDVFFDKADRKHKVAVLEYNPETLEARVKEIADISRAVALKYSLDKQSFNVLVKRKVHK